MGIISSMMMGRGVMIAMMTFEQEGEVVGELIFCMVHA